MDKDQSALEGDVVEEPKKAHKAASTPSSPFLFTYPKWQLLIVLALAVVLLPLFIGLLVLFLLWSLLAYLLRQLLGR